MTIIERPWVYYRDRNRDENALALAAASETRKGNGIPDVARSSPTCPLC